MPNLAAAPEFPTEWTWDGPPLSELLRRPWIRREFVTRIAGLVAREVGELLDGVPEAERILFLLCEKNGAAPSWLEVLCEEHADGLASRLDTLASFIAPGLIDDVWDVQTEELLAWVSDVAARRGAGPGSLFARWKEQRAGEFGDLVDAALFVYGSLTHRPDQCPCGSVHDDEPLGELTAHVHRELAVSVRPSTLFAPYVHLPAKERETRASVAGPVAEPLRNVWNATVRVVQGDCCGSGFWLENERELIVTNAHCVDEHDPVFVERFFRGYIEKIPVRVVAIDFAHDLALLRPTQEAWKGEPVSRLRLAEAARPGEPVWVAGFPLGVETQRITAGVVSGYKLFEELNVRLAAPVLDLAINQGNSGGPVVDGRGLVVGIVFAGPARFLVPAGVNMTPDIKALLTAMESTVTLPTPGFALDPEFLAEMVRTYGEVMDKVEADFFEKFPPKKMRFSKKEFVRLQQQIRDLTGKPADASAIGPFSLRDPGELLLGWREAPDRVPLNPGAWLHVIDALPDIADGPQEFVLVGTEVFARWEGRQRSGYVPKLKLELV